MDFETHTALLDLPKFYDDAICRKDAAAYGAAFTAGATWDAGVMFVARGRAEIIDRFNASFDALDWVVRMPLSTLILHYDGERAKLRTYFWELLKMSSGEIIGTDQPLLGVYTYVDDCIKEADGIWRVEHHKLHIALLGTPDMQNILQVGFPVPS